MTISKPKGIALILVAVLILVSIALVLFLHKQVTLTVNGDSQVLTTYSLKVGSLLNTLNIPLATQDDLSPPMDAWLKRMTR